MAADENIEGICQAMSTRGVDFLHRWIEENLAGFHQALPDYDLVQRMAFRCEAEAAAAGIPREEFEEEFGNLETIIAEAILNDPTAEVTAHMRHSVN
jgi:hypothetical protein